MCNVVFFFVRFLFFINTLVITTEQILSHPNPSFRLRTTKLFDDHSSTQPYYYHHPPRRYQPTEFLAPVRRRLQARGQGKVGALHKHKHPALSHSPSWVPDPSFQSHFEGRRKFVTDEKDIELQLIQDVRNNARSWKPEEIAADASNKVSESVSSDKNEQSGKSLLRDIPLTVPTSNEGTPPIMNTQLVNNLKRIFSQPTATPKRSDAVKKTEILSPPNVFHQAAYNPTLSEDELHELVEDKLIKPKSIYLKPHIDHSHNLIADTVATASDNNVPPPHVTANMGQVLPMASSEPDELMRWPAQAPLEKFVQTIAPNVGTLMRYRIAPDRVFQSIDNQIVYDNWWAEWTRVGSTRSTWALIANDYGFFSGGIGLKYGVTDFNTGWRDVIVTEFTNRANQEIAVGAAKGRYGVFVDRSQTSRATVIEALSRYVETSSLADFGDRDYGQRIRVRNFEIAIRHDFDEHMRPDNTTFATEVLVAYGGVAISVSTDVADSRYGIAFGFRGREVAIQQNFNKRITELLADWGRGWELAFSTDLVDLNSDQIFARLSFGRLGHAFFGAGMCWLFIFYIFYVGAGISDDGMPLATAEAQLPDVAFNFQLQDYYGDQLLQYALSVGKMTFVWKSVVALPNLRLPFVLPPQLLQNLILNPAIT